MKKIKQQLKKILQIIVKLLSEGVLPQKLSLAIALAVTTGVIPFFGINTILLTIISLAFGLNIPLIQIVNYAMYPIQILLYIPFLKAGTIISGHPELQLTFSQAKTMFKNGWWQAVQDLWQIHLWGLAVWFVVCLPVGLITYFVLNNIFCKYKNGQENYIIKKLKVLKLRIGT